MDRFEFNRSHIQDQFCLRYKKFQERFDEIFDMIASTLKSRTPDNWRFTESPTSRFFVIEEETGAKFMGLSYRGGPECRKIVDEIKANSKANSDNPEITFSKIDDYVDKYIAEINNPNLPIIHQIRTVYGRKKGEIGEEKDLHHRSKSAVSHIIPLVSRKIAARPNVVITRNGELWVRQYLNWVSMKKGSKEYYLFHPLNREGIERNRYAIFSYSENGSLNKLPEKRFDDYFPKLSRVKHDIFSDAGKENIKIEPEIRTESYWRVPTYLDRRLIDLDFRERDSEKITRASLSAESKGISSSELFVLYFLRKIVDAAKQQLYSK